MLISLHVGKGVDDVAVGGSMLLGLPKNAELMGVDLASFAQNGTGGVRVGLGVAGGEAHVSGIDDSGVSNLSL